MNPITPRPVAAGDKVAIVAPSSQVSLKAVEIAVERLTELYDLSPVIYPSVKADDRLDPETRAEELHRAFESDATAVFSVSGGEDQMRLLQHLNLNRLRSNPTRFFGISDNTHLHLALSAAGVVSYYGCQFVPGLSWDPKLPDYTQRYLERALFRDTIGRIYPSERWTEDHYDIDSGSVREWSVNPGWTWEFPENHTVVGTVWGGCFIVIEHLLAVDKFVPDPEDMEGYVLAVESSGLVPDTYYVKSVLRCLGERGLLNSVAAIIVGRPKTKIDGKRGGQTDLDYRNTQRDAIQEVCREYTDETRILFDLDFGHTDPQVPIPIGGRVRLNPDEQSVTFLS
jgi:muramoyltetrapeptide carboxypeptidase LdcA involved in peptidoglycan recycling